MLRHFAGAPVKTSSSLVKLIIFAVATLLAQAWSRVAVDRLAASSLKYPDPALAADCLTGAWIAGVDDIGLTLSPGDVDEGIVALVLARDTTSRFELAKALRAGFTSGAAACVAGLA